MKPCLIWLILILAYACPNLAVEHGDDELLAVVAAASASFAAAASAFSCMVSALQQKRRDEIEAEEFPLNHRLPPGGRGGKRPNRKQPDARRPWLTGLHKWRVKQPGQKSYYEQEWLSDLSWVDRADCDLMRKDFRRYFRVPWSIYDKIMNDAYKNPAWKPKNKGPKGHPLAIKVSEGREIL